MYSLKEHIVFQKENILVKQLSIKAKERILRASRQKKQVTNKGGKSIIWPEAYPHQHSGAKGSRVSFTESSERSMTNSQTVIQV